jgi:hypothetical protein
MQQLNRQDIATQSDVSSDEPTFPLRTQPGRPARGIRIAAIVGLTVLLYQYSVYTPDRSLVYGRSGRGQPALHGTPWSGLVCA